jgi:predicted dehydrogenase
MANTWSGRQPGRGVDRRRTAENAGSGVVTFGTSLFLWGTGPARICNTVMLLDFGDNLFAFTYGTASGMLTHGFNGSYFGTRGSIVGLTLNGQPLEYPGSELARKLSAGSGVEWQFQNVGNQWLLPHINDLHRHLPEQHVFEDIMQLLDLVIEGKPSIVTAEHAAHVIDIIESAYRANTTGQTQVLTTTLGD